MIKWAWIGENSLIVEQDFNEETMEFVDGIGLGIGYLGCSCVGRERDESIVGKFVAI